MGGGPIEGRQKGIVRKFVRDESKPDADGKIYCGQRGCTYFKKSRTFQASRWAEHIVLDCKHAPTDIRDQVAKEHTAMRMTAMYKPLSTPSWMTPSESTPGAGVGGAAGATRKNPDGGDHGESSGENPSKKARIKDHVDKCSPARCCCRGGETGA